jgi:GNAT superfamily N-acetyltransferase
LSAARSAGPVSAERIAAAYAAAIQLFAGRAPLRFSTRVGGVPVVGFGLPERWATHVVALPEPPPQEHVMGALDWCREQGRAAQVDVTERARGRYPRLEVADELPVFAVAAAGATFERSALVVRPARNAAEFAAVYAAAFEMRPGMAEALVVDADIGAPGLGHLIGAVDGQPVACATLRFAEGLAFVNGLGVVPAAQGRGYGTEMLGRCRSEAATRGCDALWLHASARSRGFYEALGYALVDVHVALTGD